MVARRAKGNLLIRSGATAFVTLLAILFGSVGSVRAQVNDSAEKPQARLVDEFSSAGSCELGARIDAFLIEIQNNSGSKGYVFSYNGINVLPAYYESPHYERAIMNHIVPRRFDKSRITFVRGGFLDSPLTQFWLVPEGATPPETKRSSLEAPSIPQDRAFKFDQKYIGDFDGGDDGRFVLDSVLERERIEFGEDLDEDGEASETIDELVEEIPEIAEDQLDHYWLSSAFGGFLSLRPEWNGVVIFYADDQRYDIAKLTNRIYSAVNRYEQDGDRIAGRVRVVYGGYRDSLEADFFAVPPGAGDPKPTPAERKADVEDWDQ
ncbi:MAG TPA: hypothetical protein DEP46_13695 [Blastocatellia bacterium]|jgi:hypothetical protein|nr:hypothetical protein [Blastocatellia bacterium]